MANYQEREALSHKHSLYYAADAPGRADDRAREKSGNLASDAECFAVIRPDANPKHAARLGIDTSRPLRIAELGNLLDNRRADGRPIHGKQYQGETASLADVFGLDPKRLPAHEELSQVLAGRRVDGGPLMTKGEKPIPLSDERVNGARVRFLEVMGVRRDREATPEHIRAILDGKTAAGFEIDLASYRRGITATKAPVGFVDFSFHPDKSVSVAYARAKTPAERGIYRDAVEGAAVDTMAYAEKMLGFARRGKAGADGVEPGTIMWAMVTHDTARPVREIAKHDKQGREYTDYQPVPVVADPHLHPHVLMFGSVMTAGGHIGSPDLDRMNGQTKHLGALFHVHLAQRLRARGAHVRLDRDSGAAVLTEIDRKACRALSKRKANAQEAAEEFARQQGVDWNSLPEKRRYALLQRGIEEQRERKEGPPQFDDWQRQADAVDPHYRSPLHRHKAAELTPERRIELAVTVAESMLAKKFHHEAVISESEVRETIIRGFVETGIGDPARDIDSAMDRVRENGIRLGHEHTRLIFDVGERVRGKTRLMVTTSLAEAQEQHAISLARTANADHSAAIPQPELDRHVAATGIKFTDEQRIAINRLAGPETGCLEVVIGSGGVGKTTLLKAPVRAWKAAGMDVHGVALQWSHAKKLVDAGVEDEKCVALDKLLHQARDGRSPLTRDSVVVVDEFPRIGVRQWRELLIERERSGCKIVALGDPRQCTAIERGNVVDLVDRALPHAIPELVHSIRQRTERERAITKMFRDGEEVETALRMKHDDGTFLLVAGGVRPVVERVANLWAERVSANRDDPEWSISVSAPTNAEARTISEAIRVKRREMGEIGADRMTLRAVDNAKEKYDLALSIGDRVRLYDRVFDARESGPRRALGSNGDVLEVRQLSERGMLVRNSEGREGMVEWRKLREGRNDPVRLSLGYALTIDAVQSMTSEEHISAYPSGTASVGLGKHHTALSRQRSHNWLVVNDSAERQQIANRGPWSGSVPAISESDVRRNIAANMARFREKSGAVEFLEHAAGFSRDADTAALSALEPQQRRQRAGLGHGPRQALRHIRERAHAVSRRVSELTHSIRRAHAPAHEKPELRQRQGQGPRMSM